MTRLRANLRDRGLAATLRKAVLVLSNKILTPIKKRTQPDFVRSRYGVWMKANWGDATFRTSVEGMYGRTLADHLTSLAEPFAFLDIGSNQGLYALLAGTNPRCRQVIALEPVAGTAAILAANVARNGIAERTRVLRAGLSSAAGEARIAFDSRHTGAASLRAAAPHQRFETIELITMRELDAELPEGLPLHVKVDVEGHEETVIEQLAASRHAGRIEFVFVEIDERWTDAARIRELLAAIGLRRIETVGAGFHYDLAAYR